MKSNKLLWGIVTVLLTVTILFVFWLKPTQTTQATQATQATQNSSAPPLAQPLATTKDEISKFRDINERLEQQQETLHEQHKNADELIKLKQQQIALLEQQLKSNP